MSYHFNSTYGLQTYQSFKGETFKSIPLTWKLGVSRIEAFKIRIAAWKPKYNRNEEAIFYFEVNNLEEAKSILNQFEQFDFKQLEYRFDTLYELDKVRIKNTGETREWLKKIIPVLQAEFPIQIKN